MSTFGVSFPALAEALSEALSEAENGIGFGGEEKLALLGVVMADVSRFCILRGRGAVLRKQAKIVEALAIEKEADEIYEALPNEIIW